MDMDMLRTLFFVVAVVAVVVVVVIVVTVVYLMSFGKGVDQKCPMVARRDELDMGR